MTIRIIKPGRLVGLSNERNRPQIDGPEGIYDEISASIVDQRLPPGTKLNELTLCEIFNTGRRQISQALTRLAHDGLVTLHANRGAFVSAPEVSEARDILKARKLIEPQIARAVAEEHDEAGLDRLRANIRDEEKRRHAGAIREAVLLSGEFHIVLGEISGNSVVRGLIRILVARTSLVVSLYENQGTMGGWHDDHDNLIKLLEQSDGEGAAALMKQHLQEIEDDIDLTRKRGADPDLRAIYAPKSSR